MKRSLSKTQFKVGDLCRLSRSHNFNSFPLQEKPENTHANFVFNNVKNKQSFYKEDFAIVLHVENSLTIYILTTKNFLGYIPKTMLEIVK